MSFEAVPGRNTDSSLHSQGVASAREESPPATAGVVSPVPETERLQRQRQGAPRRTPGVGEQPPTPTRFGVEPLQLGW